MCTSNQLPKQNGIANRNCSTKEKRKYFTIETVTVYLLDRTVEIPSKHLCARKKLKQALAEKLGILEHGIPTVQLMRPDGELSKIMGGEDVRSAQLAA